MEINYHKRVLLLFFVLLVSIKVVFSQNLVPNGNFEKQSHLFFIRSLLFLSNWNNPNSANPEFVRNEINWFGNQKARSGKSYVSLEYSHLKLSETDYGKLFYIAYVQVRLKQKLKKDSLYCIKLFTSLADNYDYAIEKMEVGFSKSKIMSFGNQLYIHPDYFIKLESKGVLLNDYYGWTENCNCFKASGSEKNLQIGFFSKEMKLHHVTNKTPKFYATNYYIDDVSLFPISDSNSCDCKKKFP